MRQIKLQSNVKMVDRGTDIDLLRSGPLAFAECQCDIWKENPMKVTKDSSTQYEANDAYDYSKKAEKNNDTEDQNEKISIEKDGCPISDGKVEIFYLKIVFFIPIFNLN